MSSSRSVGSESRMSSQVRSSPAYRPLTSNVANSSGMANPFYGSHGRFATDEELDDSSVDSDGSNASVFSVDDDLLEDKEDKAAPSGGSTISSFSGADRAKRMMIPIPWIEAELDLEADERRCLEEITLSGMAQQQSGTARQRMLPRYADPILALRILVECLAKMKRLDDVERVMSEGLEREIRRIVRREQALTFARLERRGVQPTVRTIGRKQNLKELRRHLAGLLSAFGCVMIRLSHLAEILRLRIVS
jgi:hypothetical protein